jgi:ketosteroid isomerase-like protein
MSGRTWRQIARLYGTAGTFHGYDGLWRSAQEIFGAFREVQFVPKRLKGRGDQVLATVEVRASGKESGLDFPEAVAHIWTLREGRIVVWQVYLDPSEALEAAGLSE